MLNLLKNYEIHTVDAKSCFICPINFFTWNTVYFSVHGRKGKSKKGKSNKANCLFGLAFFFTYIFFLLLLPFWFCHLLASCLSGFLILPFWFLNFAFLALKRADWYDLRQVRGRQVREVLAGSSIQVQISINTDERCSRDGLYSARAASPPCGTTRINSCYCLCRRMYRQVNWWHTASCWVTWNWWRLGYVKEDWKRATTWLLSAATTSNCLGGPWPSGEPEAPRRV